MLSNLGVSGVTMAIKFNFTLNDDDSENLIDFLRSEKFKYSDLIIEEMAGENRSEFIQYFKDQYAYAQRLIDKVVSGQEKVQDSPENSCGQPLLPLIFPSALVLDSDKYPC